MSAMKITFLLAIAGHLLCGVCDCLLTYMPNGRFHFEDMKDNDRLSAVFKGLPLRNSLLSMLLGVRVQYPATDACLDADADWRIGQLGRGDHVYRPAVPDLRQRKI